MILHILKFIDYFRMQNIPLKYEIINYSIPAFFSSNFVEPR